jgi:non-heme chloroperoxidase
LIDFDAASDWAFYDASYPQIKIEMNELKKRIDEIEAGGVDEQKKLPELESSVARFEEVLHQNNEDDRTMLALPPLSPIRPHST